VPEIKYNANLRQNEKTFHLSPAVKGESLAGKKGDTKFQIV